MTIKIQIRSRCEYCHGEAYLPVGEAVSVDGEKYTRHLPCPICQGEGETNRWISLRDFYALLSDAAVRDPMEVDWSALAHVDPVSQYRDSLDSAGI
jgi:hypothetical protein